MKQLDVLVLSEYLAWISAKGHEIESYRDYGDCGDESLRCRAPGCHADRYEWDADHVRMFASQSGFTL